MQKFFLYGDTSIQILSEYLKYRKGPPDDYLFCNIKGQQLGTRGLETAIRRYNRNRGVSKTSVHLYRHTFARDFIRNGGDPLRLQSFLDHSTLAVTREYVNLFSDDLKVSLQSTNPLERFCHAGGDNIKMK